MENKKAKKTWDFLSHDFKIHTYKNPTHTIKIKMKWNNESYELINEPVKDLGYNKTFKDYIYDELNPVIDNSNIKYGEQAPNLTIRQRIQKAEQRLLDATTEKHKLEQQIKELEQVIKTEQPEKGEPDNDK